MKKIVSLSILVSLIGFAGTGVASAQVSSLATSSLTAETAKRDAVRALKAEMGQLKAEKSFVRANGISDAVSWYKEDNLIYAFHQKDGVVTRALYRPNGSWIRTIKYYNAENCPAKVLRQVKGEFREYEVRDVVEWKSHLNHFYILHVLKGTDFKQVVWNDGELSIYKELTLSEPVKP